MTDSLESNRKYGLFITFVLYYAECMEYVLIITVAVLPAVGLLYYIYWKDKYKKEPMGLLWKGFGYGALSAIVAVLFNTLLYITGLAVGEAYTFWGHLRVALFEAAIPEELIKFLFLWLLLRRNRYYDEYFDGIVYAASIGLGFAAVENISYLFQNYETWVSVGILRALVSVPGHFMFGITMGFFYAKATFGDPTQRKKNLALALCLPILFHAAFDATLMVSEILAGAMAAFYSLYIYLVEKSKRRGRDHLALDKKNLNINQESIPHDIQEPTNSDEREA